MTDRWPRPLPLIIAAATTEETWFFSHDLSPHLMSGERPCVQNLGLVGVRVVPAFLASWPVRPVVGLSCAAREWLLSCDAW